MKNLKIVGSISGLLILSSIVTGCGSKTNDTALGTSSSATTATATSASGNIYNLPAAQQQLVQIGGSGSTNATATINTDGAGHTLSTSATLKVKVTPLVAPNLPAPNSAWNFPYGCFQVNVTVNGSVKSTGMLRVAGVAQSASSVCASAPTYIVLDFSSIMTGNGPVSVTISNPYYDNCRYNWPNNYGCALVSIAPQHLVAANIAVQTDNTWLDP